MGGMKKILFLGIYVAAMAGCAQVSMVEKPVDGGTGLESEAQGPIRPHARPSDLDITARVAPPKSARTVEEFDTTTKAERTAATEKSQVSKDLGATVIGLGDPTQPGFWLKTPLVKTARKGLVSVVASGKSVQVDLIPIEGPKTAGSRISLAAIRLLGVPLTALSEVEVFRE